MKNCQKNCWKNKKLEEINNKINEHEIIKNFYLK